MEQVGFTPVSLGDGVIAGFTNRHGGVSVAPYDSLNLGPNVSDSPDPVAANRALVAQAIGAPVAFSSQVHGANIIVVAEQAIRNPVPPVTVGEADALITDSEVGLGVLVADCVPVLLAGFDAAGNAILAATAHAGRRGVELNVVSAIVAKLRELGAVRVTAAIGPAICGQCYEVPQLMRDEVCAVIPAAWSVTRQQTPGLDLPRAVAAQLRDENVEVCYRSSVCTLENADYFSHRRAAGGLTGRQAGIIRLAKTTTV